MGGLRDFFLRETEGEKSFGIKFQQKKTNKMLNAILDRFIVCDYVRYECICDAIKYDMTHYGRH